MVISQCHVPWKMTPGVGGSLEICHFGDLARRVLDSCHLGGTGLLSPGWGQHLGISRFGDSFLDFGGSFLGWHSEGSSGQLLGVLGGSLEFGRAPVLVKSSQKLKICPIF